MPHLLCGTLDELPTMATPTIVVRSNGCNMILLPVQTRTSTRTPIPQPTMISYVTQVPS